MADPSNVRAMRIKQDWSASFGQAAGEPQPKLQVAKNAWGWLKGATGDGQWSLVIIPQGGKLLNGWVPTHIVTVGALRADPIPIAIPAPPKPTGPPPPASASDSVLLRTMRALWKTIQDNGDSLLLPAEQQNDRVKHYLFGPSSNRWPGFIYQHITPEARQMMNPGNFNPAQLPQVMVPISEQRHAASKCFGVYIIVMGGINHGFSQMVTPPSTDAVYVGQSIDFPVRHRQHIGLVNSTASPTASKSNLYKLMKSANSHVLLPLVVFPRGDPEVESFGVDQLLHVTELTMTCLFRSWCPVLIRNEPNLSSAPAVAEYQYAKMWDHLAGAVFSSNASGWNPTRAVGVNWQTPLVCGMKTGHEWFSWYDPSRNAFIYRTRVSVHVWGQLGKSGGRCAVYWRAGKTINIPTALWRQASFEHKDVVYLQAEIKHDGKGYRDHPSSWARVPTPCQNRELELLRSLSLQIIWINKQTSVWNATVLQRSESRRKEGDEYAMFTQGMPLFCTLTQTAYYSPPDWLERNDRTIIHRLNIDHLGQKARLDPTPVAGRVKSWPVDNTVAENTQRLRQTLPQAYQNEVHFGAKPGSGLGGPRKDCDLCKSLMDATPCQYDPATGTCPYCASFNRPCTWTIQRQGQNLATLLQTGEALQYLGWPTYLKERHTTVQHDGGPSLPELHAQFEAEVAEVDEEEYVT